MNIKLNRNVKRKGTVVIICSSGGIDQRSSSRYSRNYARPSTHTKGEVEHGEASRYEYATRIRGIKARLHVWSGDECVQVHR